MVRSEQYAMPLGKRPFQMFCSLAVDLMNAVHTAKVVREAEAHDEGPQSAVAWRGELIRPFDDNGLHRSVSTKGFRIRQRIPTSAAPFLSAGKLGHDSANGTTTRRGATYT